MTAAIRLLNTENTAVGGYNWHLLPPCPAENIEHSLDYANAVICNTSVSNFMKLQHVQKALARIVSFLRRTKNICSVLQQLHWLSISFHINYKIATLALWLSQLICFLSHSTCWALLADDLRWPGFKSRSGREFSVGYGLTKSRLHKSTTWSVSYTHLTLPTNREV